ncbi:hypothetical protein IU498_18655 [Nocardia beijingensis]|nr:hypothetical protein [Nocardia beijingensis]
MVELVSGSKPVVPHGDLRGGSVPVRRVSVEPDVRISDPFADCSVGVESCFAPRNPEYWQTLRSVSALSCAMATLAQPPHAAAMRRTAKSLTSTIGAPWSSVKAGMRNGAPAALPASVFPGLPGAFSSGGVSVPDGSWVVVAVTASGSGIDVAHAEIATVTALTIIIRRMNIFPPSRHDHHRALVYAHGTSTRCTNDHRAKNTNGRGIPRILLLQHGSASADAQSIW